VLQIEIFVAPVLVALIRSHAGILLISSLKP
jgi:hypothetical protein